MQTEIEQMVASLSEKERQALDLVCRGAGYREIARALHLTRWAFKGRIDRAHRKIGVSNRLEALRLLKGTEIRERLLVGRTAQRFGLSEREMEVLALLCAGMSRREIARKLYVVEGTVSAHIRQIGTKVGVEKHVGVHITFAIIARLIAATGDPPPLL